MTKSEQVICTSGDSIDVNQSEIDLYRAIMPLRVLQLPQDDFNYLLEFMDHEDDRDDPEVDLVPNIIRDTWGQTQYTPEMIR